MPASRWQMASKQLTNSGAIPPDYWSPPEPGCLDSLKAQLLTPADFIDCWPARSVTDGQRNGQQILVFPDHASWYEDVKARVCRKSWRPSDLRVVCGDFVTTARLATWLRKSKWQKLASDWNVGEYVRLLDPVHAGDGSVLEPANQEYKITLVRPISFGDTRGVLHWTTPKRSEPRQLDVSIAPMDLQAVRLSPLDGGRPVAALVERPGQSIWRETCRRFQEILNGARHQPDVFEQGLQWVDELQRQVPRLRSAAVLPADRFVGHRSTAIALHARVSNVFGADACARVAQIVAGAEQQLLIYKESVRE